METVTKENITPFTWDHSNSLQSDNVEDIVKINNFLMIELELTINNKTIRRLKYHSVYLLNNAKHSMQNIPN